MDSLVPRTDISNEINKTLKMFNEKNPWKDR